MNRLFQLGAKEQKGRKRTPLLSGSRMQAVLLLWSLGSPRHIIRLHSFGIKNHNLPPRNRDTGSLRCKWLQYSCLEDMLKIHKHYQIGPRLAQKRTAGYKQGRPSCKEFFLFLSSSVSECQHYTHKYEWGNNYCSMFKQQTLKQTSKSLFLFFYRTAIVGVSTITVSFGTYGRDQGLEPYS